MATMERVETFHTRARARGLVVPDEEVVSDPDQKEVVWTGRAFALQPKGRSAGTAGKWTHLAGAPMIGQVEVPAHESTKLVGGKYKFVNAPTDAKEGYLWRPGNRYTKRCQKIDEIAPGEKVIKQSTFVHHLVDDQGRSLRTGRLLWNAERFANVPGMTGFKEYERISQRLQETSSWALARPPQQFAPGFAEYTMRPMGYDRMVAAQAPLPTPPPGTYNVKEANGDVTIVPQTQAIAADFGASRLVPAERKAVPNGPASFAVHGTPNKDLKWATRVLSQRTAGNVPIRGPGNPEFFIQRGFVHSFQRLVQSR